MRHNIFLRGRRMMHSIANFKTQNLFPRKLSESGLFAAVKGHKMQPGVIPYSVNAPLWSDAMLGYGAVILSFIGALHWGVAMCATGLDPAQRRRAFLWSVAPALLAWLATVVDGAINDNGTPDDPNDDYPYVVSANSVTLRTAYDPETVTTLELG